jgi:hypothetical protein
MLISSVGDDLYHANTNPAILAQLSSNSVALIYSSIYNLIPYTKIVSNFQCWGLGLAYLGKDNYHEYVVSIARGFELNQYLSYGIMLRGYFLNCSPNLRLFMPGLDGGISALLYRDSQEDLKIIKISAVMENINSPILKKEELDQPFKFTMGILFQLNQSLKIGAEIKKFEAEAQFLAGTEFKISSPAVLLRLGFQSYPLLIASGLGINISNLSLDYGIRYHWALKTTNTISLSFRW